MVMPPAVLHDELAAARAEGADFDTAWPPAVTVATSAACRRERAEWREALEDTRDAWRRAYVGAPTDRAERALIAAAVDPDREPCPRGACGYCGKPLPADAHRLARYCNREHQRAMHGRKLTEPVAA